MPDPITSALGAMASTVEGVVPAVGAVTAPVDSTVPLVAPEVQLVPGLLEQITSFRPVPPPEQVVSNLGVLAKLAGRWRGTGFNLIARPDFQGGSDIFLELNLTQEELDFTPIGGPVPNRGSGQNDIDLFGLTYLQQISDATDGGGIHIEPGIWVTVPATTDPSESPSVTRLATIPHGNAVAIEGSGFLVPGGPRISPANTGPFPMGTPVPAPGTPNAFAQYDLSTPTLFRTDPLPAGITQTMINDPNTVLTDRIVGQNITETVVLVIGTVPSIDVVGDPNPHQIRNGGGGAENIPFLQQNANVSQVTAIFWIETVQSPRGRSFMQLQYTQTVLLDFLGLSWPHVTVANLVKYF